MYAAMASELEMMTQSGQEIKNSLKRLDIPLKVLGRDMESGVKWNVDAGLPQCEAIKFESLWQSLIKEEASISTKGQFIEVKGSKHSIYRTNLGFVVKVVNDVIAEIE